MFFASAAEVEDTLLVAINRELQSSKMNWKPTNMLRIGGKDTQRHRDNEHLGPDMIIHLLKSRVSWPVMKKDIQTWLAGCPICQINAYPKKKQRIAPLHPLPVVIEPFSRWGTGFHWPTTSDQTWKSLASSHYWPRNLLAYHQISFRCNWENHRSVSISRHCCPLWMSRRIRNGPWIKLFSHGHKTLSEYFTDQSFEDVRIWSTNKWKDRTLQRLFGKDSH